MRSRFTRCSCERWDQSSAQFRYERGPGDQRRIATTSHGRERVTAMTCWSPLMPMTTRELALRGVRIGAVIAEQQAHRLLGDAVD